MGVHKEARKDGVRRGRGTSWELAVPVVGGGCKARSPLLGHTRG